MKTIRPLFVAAVFLFLLACSSLSRAPLIERLTASPTPPEYLYTISGTLNPARQTTIPRNTRVLVLWLLKSEEPEAYGYIFGEGRLDFEKYAFVIHFASPPPAEALYQVGDASIGIGFVILTANQEWEGLLQGDEFPKEEVLGISANQAVIYLDGSFDSESSARWVARFEQGYNVGSGVETGEAFDTFEPASPNSFQIIIDDFDNLHFLNFF